MPVKPFTQSRSSDYDTLVNDLFSEWANPDPAAAEPVILEERDRSQKLVHLYVIWSRWADIDRIERSEIIMDAAEKKLGQAEAIEIMMAMGLTPNEARQMGIGT